MMLTYGSVCSGIEAASVALEPLGFSPLWFSEIEAAPIKVLTHHWPHVENLGDMTKIKDLIELGLVDIPDVLVGGTPCQSFSVAGLRNGLSDERGQLTLEYMRLANAIDAKRNQQKREPAIIVWENVPGILTAEDNAFGCFLAGLAGEDDPLEPTGKKWTNAGCVFGPQRTIAWRVLDSQYFGVAQRRRRVFVVASARNGFDPCEVLFEREGVRRDIEPWTEYWATTDSRESTQRTFDMTGFGQYGRGISASTLKARDYKDATDLVIDKNGKVRKLTLIERERLQGFKDNHTDVTSVSDSARYMMLGNSMAVPCMRFIGSRIQQLIE